MIQSTKRTRPGWSRRVAFASAALAGAMLLAAAELAEARTGRAPAVSLDVDRLAIAVPTRVLIERDKATETIQELFAEAAVVNRRTAAHVVARRNRAGRLVASRVTLHRLDEVKGVPAR
jgi:hypothetical protein